MISWSEVESWTCKARRNQIEMNNSKCWFSYKLSTIRLAVDKINWEKHTTMSIYKTLPDSVLKIASKIFEIFTFKCIFKKWMKWTKAYALMVVQKTGLGTRERTQ